jgi:dCMP deaminase
MIIAILTEGGGLPKGLTQTASAAGFAIVDLAQCVPAAGNLLSRARENWGADFRVRLATGAFDPLRNELVAGVDNIEEILLLSRVAPTGVLDTCGSLSTGEIDMLEAARIPVDRLAGMGTLLAGDYGDVVMALAARMSRVPWDEYFMRIAHIVASRGDCVKRRVAAIIVKDRRIVATGYNGAPRGTRNCSSGGCSRCASFQTSGTRLDECLCSHGEENAITQAAYHGISVRDATLFSTCSPCLLCTKMIINSGIAEVVYNAAYPLGERSLELLRESGVKVRQYAR